jgi:MFS family permease
MIRDSFPSRQGFRSWGALAAIFYSGIASSTLLTLKPLIVGALIDDYRFSAAQAGFVAGIEMAGIGLASLVVGAAATAWRRRRVIAWGAALAVTGSLVPWVPHAYGLVLCLRLVAGFGSGLIAASVFASLGAARDPDRIFGIYLVSAYAIAGSLFPLASTVIARHGASGAYLLLAAIICAVIPISRGIPDAAVQRESAAGPAPALLKLKAACSLAVSLVFWLGNGAVWAFVERLGLNSRMTSLEVAGVLSASQIAFMGGAVLASMVHTRFGRTLPTFGAMAVTMAGTSLIGWGGSALAFCAGVLLFCFAWPLFLAYLNGTMATQDPAGRIVALSIASQTVGMAIGPAIAGVLAHRLGYSAVSGMALASYLLAILLLLPLAAVGRVPRTAITAHAL